jgi:hypothetical protein
VSTLLLVLLLALAARPLGSGSCAARRHLVVTGIHTLLEQLPEGAGEHPGVRLPLGEPETGCHILVQHPCGEEVLLFPPVAVVDVPKALWCDFSTTDFLQAGTTGCISDAQRVDDVFLGLGELLLGRRDDHGLEPAPVGHDGLLTGTFIDQPATLHRLPRRGTDERIEQTCHTSWLGRLEVSTDQGEGLADGLLSAVDEHPSCLGDLFGQSDNAELQVAEVLGHAENVGGGNHAISLALEHNGDGPSAEESELPSEQTHDLEITAFVRLFLVDLNPVLVIEGAGESQHLVRALGRELDALIPTDLVGDMCDLEPGSVLLVSELLSDDAIPSIQELKGRQAQGHGEQPGIALAPHGLGIDLPEEHAGQGRSSAPASVDGVRDDGGHQSTALAVSGGHACQSNLTVMTLSGQCDLRLDVDSLISNTAEVGGTVLVEEEDTVLSLTLDDLCTLETTFRSEAELHDQGDVRLGGVHDHLALDGLNSVREMDAVASSTLAALVGGQHAGQDDHDVLNDGTDRCARRGVDQGRVRLTCCIRHVGSFATSRTWILLNVRLRTSGVFTREGDYQKT